MSKTTLGQTCLGLTARLLVSTGLVLTLTQSLDEIGMAGKSLAELRQQSWTQQIFSGKTVDLQGIDSDVSEFLPADHTLRTGSLASRFSGKSVTQDETGALIQIAKISKNDGEPEKMAAGAVYLEELSEGFEVNRQVKSDRRLGWGWEPYKVAHGKRPIALNWSGSLWSMNGPFSEETDFTLPKLAFAPSDDLRLVMADASRFLLPEIIDTAPDSMIASNDAVDPSGLQNGDVNGANPDALAYAPTSVEALEEPFKAILTEQRTGQISEDNQVTVLGAVEELKNGDDPAAKETEVAALAPLDLINALPRARVARPEAQDAQAELSHPLPVSKPLDTSPIVANLAAKEEAKDIEQAATEDEQQDIGLTLAKSRARRAELKLASLSGDTEDKEKKKSRWASWFNFSSTKKAKIVTKGEHAWISNKLPKSSFTKKQKTCLANAIYFESRSEPEEGQIAVGQVVINRVKNPAYPNSICGVVYQNQHMRNSCQFSFACDNIPDRVRSKKAWDVAWKLANEVVNGEVWLKNVGSSTHYHATYVHPKWARTMKKRDKIGLHIFYKTYGGGWS